MQPLTLTLLGSFHAVHGDQSLPGFRTKATQALLIYLATQPDEAHNRERLMTLLWPGMPQKSARANLRQTLYQLRQDISEVKAENESAAVDPVIANRQEIQLNPAADIQTDVIRFEALLDQAASHDHPDLFLCPVCRQSFEAAAALYQGDFLNDFYLEDSNAFENWAQSQREHYRRRALDTLSILTTMAIRRREYPQAQQSAERQLHIDNLNEGAYRQLMKVLALNGRREQALAAYDKCRRVLAEELGMAPTQRTTDLYEKILAGDLDFRTAPQYDVRGYELKELIAEGGHGAVHRAIQPLIGREVAVKVIRRQHADDPAFIRRFEAEAQIVARLEHPHIVPLYDYWRDPNGAYLVMRYMRHGSLLSALETGTWEPAQAAGLLNQVAAALSAAHQQGIVHRDIKPGNILLDEVGNAYLTDFGIAKDLLSQEQITSENAVVGTLDYTSPEQILSGEVTPQSDIYSLGAVIYETLTGEKPFADDSIANLLHNQLNTPMPLVSATRPDVPAEVDTVLQKATAKKAAERYATAQEMAEAFFAAVCGTAVERGYDMAEHFTPEVAEIYNPYKGLRAFQEADADDFFGRDNLVQQLVDRLGESSSRFLAIVGPSGSGKSSAVKAGLIPALRNGALPGSESWFKAEMVPGTHPLEELELALWPVAVDPPPSLVEPMERDTRGMLRTVRRILPDGDGSQPQLLLIIDQFEELFTLVEDPQRREFFLDSLLTALTASRSPLRVVITLRADFYDLPLLHQEWGQIIKDNTEIVLPLNHSELTWAIREPARRMGVLLEEELVAAIVGDVVDQLGALPLLQYALTELFERRENNLIAHDAYQAIGGVQGALGRRAEAIYESLDQNGREATRQLFLRLVTLGEGSEDTRRRVLRTELTTLLHNSHFIIHYSLLETVLDSFGSARLLTFDRDPTTRTPTVEVAHEALLREWPRLRRWLEQSRDDIRLQRLLAQAAGEWMTAEKDDAYLLRGSRLEQFGAWAEETQLALTQDEKNYFAASLAARSARREVEEKRRQRELEAARQLAELEKARADEQAQAAGRLRQRAVLLGGALVAAAILAIAAFFFAQQSNQNAVAAQQNADAAATSEAQAIANAGLAAANEAEAILNLELAKTREEEAIAAETEALNAQATALAEADFRATAEAETETERDEALLQQRLTRSRELALAAQYNLDKDPELSVMLALEALATEYTLEAELILHQAIQASDVRQTFTGHTAETVQLAFTPDGSRLVSTSFDGTARVWDVATGTELATFTNHGDEVYSVAIDPSGEWAVTGGLDGTARKWDLNTGEELLLFPDFHIQSNSIDTTLDLSPDGGLLATPGQDKTIKIWDTETGELVQTFNPPMGAEGVEFSPDGQLLASSDYFREGTTVVIWEIDTGKVLLVIPDVVTWQGANFSPDNKLLRTTSSDGTVMLWDLEASLSAGIPQEYLRLNNTNNTGLSFASFAFTPDSQWLVIDDAIYDINTGNQLKQFVSDAPGLFFWPVVSPDGRTVAHGSQSGIIQIRNINPFGNSELYNLEANAGAIREIATNSDDSLLATAGFYDKTSQLWDLNTGTFINETLEQQEGNMGSVSISPDGLLIATADTEFPIATVWDAETGEKLMELEHGPAVSFWRVNTGVVQVDFNPNDGRYLASAGADGTARIWDLKTGEAIHIFQAAITQTAMIQAEFSPDGSRLATFTNSPNALLTIWDILTGEPLVTVPDLPDRAWGLSFSPDGRLVAAGGTFGWLKVWDASTGIEAASFQGHTDTVLGLDFSEDGEKIVTASGDNTVRIWEAATGVELYRLTLSYLPTTALFHQNDSQLLVSVFEDGVIRAYTLLVSELIEVGRSRVTRPFTLEECRQYRIDPCPGKP